MDAASITADEYAQLRAATMPEKRLQDSVIGAARSLGWRVYHTYSSVRSEPGYPDLHLLHTRHKMSALVELKAMKGRLSPAQTAWLRDLATVGTLVAVWRPIDWTNTTIHQWLAEPHKTPLPGWIS
jgi:hypothetical protein